MCRLVYKDISEGHTPQVLKDLLFIAGEPSTSTWRPKSPQDIAEKLFHTAYLGMETNSSPETRARSKNCKYFIVNVLSLSTNSASGQGYWLVPCWLVGDTICYMIWDLTVNLAILTQSTMLLSHSSRQSRLIHPSLRCMVSIFAILSNDFSWQHSRWNASIKSRTSEHSRYYELTPLVSSLLKKARGLKYWQSARSTTKNGFELPLCSITAHGEGSKFEEPGVTKSWRSSCSWEC
jgi:hypothetical protein